MRKSIFFIFLTMFFVFSSTKLVFASSVANFFGGRIIFKPAQEIFTLEKTNFNCKAGLAGGTSISILPIGSAPGTPISYYIPPFTRSMTGTIPTMGQLILGRYGGKMPIACIYQGYPPVTVIVPLNVITYFGTSIK